MTYLVHINPTPGSDLRVVEVEADGYIIREGTLSFFLTKEKPFTEMSEGRMFFNGVACFSPAVWNYVEPKK